LRAGHAVSVIDNLSNSSDESLRRVQELAGGELTFHRADLRDVAAVEHLFAGEQIDAVLHFAGLKAVGESVQQPLLYWDNNISGSLVLFEAMVRHGVKTVVFSSSCTVYGDPASVPIREDFPVSAVNPYGMTKLTIEQILHDLYRADNTWAISAALFQSGGCGCQRQNRRGAQRDPQQPRPLHPGGPGQATSLRSLGRLSHRDGTGVRDYIHVTDLVIGHLRALDELRQGPGSSPTTSAPRDTRCSKCCRRSSASWDARSASSREAPPRTSRRPGRIHPGAAGLGVVGYADLNQMCADAAVADDESGGIWE
jgi:UDP-glucose 4-epimerase